MRRTPRLLLLACCLFAVASRAAADTSAVMLRQLLTRCNDGSPDGAFIELVASGPGQTFDPAVGIAAYDRLGHVLFNLPHVFASRAGTAWPEGSRVIFATSAFAGRASSPADVVVPKAPDDGGGRILLYGLDSPDGPATSQDELEYGLSGATPAAPGRSLIRQDDGSYAVQTFPDPRNLSGSNVTSACFGPGPRAFAIDELALACRDSSTTGQYVMLVPTGAGQWLDSDVRLRVRDRSGQVLGEIAQVFQAALDIPWPAGSHWTLASPALVPAGQAAADGVLPFTLDAQAGSLELLGGPDSAEVVLASASYGTPLNPTPTPGGCLRRVPSVPGQYAFSPTPAPINRAGQPILAPDCLGIDPRDLRVGEFATRCLDGGRAEQFLSLDPGLSTPTFSSDLGLRFFDHAGTLLADMTSPFGPRVNTPWAPGSRFLLMSLPLEQRSLVAGDGELPVQLDTASGRIEIYARVGATSKVLRTLAYGVGGSIPAPAPGSSVNWNGTQYLGVSAPTPANSHGVIVHEIECYPVRTQHVHIQGLALRCFDGSTSAQYVELQADSATAFGYQVGLRFYDRSGALIADAPGVMRSLLGAPWNAGIFWLAGGPGLQGPAGRSTDFPLPAALDPVGGTIRVYDAAAGDTLWLDTLAYGPGQAVAAPPSGFAIDRTSPGVFALQVNPQPSDRLGGLFSASQCFGQPVLHLSELALQCRDSSTAGQFIELGVDGYQPTLDPTFGVRYFDRAGTLLADVAHPFGASAGQPWPSTHGWLLTQAGFPMPAGLTPDAILPVAMDPVAGSVETYARRASGVTVLHRLTYDSVTSPANRPSPGASLVWSSAAGFVANATPHPTTFAGDSVTAPGCLHRVIDDHAILTEAFFQCRNGITDMRFIEMAANAPSAILDPAIGVRMYSSTGALLYDLPSPFGAAAGLAWPANQRWLLGAGADPAMMTVTPNRIAPIQFDVTGGLVQLYRKVSPGVVTVVDSLRYGTSALPAPPAGYSLARASLISPAWTAGVPTPENYDGVHGALISCSTACPASLFSIPYQAPDRWVDLAHTDSVITGAPAVQYHIDLAAGTFQLTGSARMRGFDEYMVEGGAPGTPVSLRARLDGVVTDNSYCVQGPDYSLICSGGYGAVSLHGPEGDVAAAPPIPGPHSYFISVPIATQVGQPFIVQFDADVIPSSTSPSAGSLASGRLMFTDYPAGLIIRSCHGFLQDVSQPVPTLVANVTGHAVPGRAIVQWQLESPATTALHVQRSTDMTSWQDLANVSPDPSQAVQFEDSHVEARQRYGYRLAWSDPQRGTVTAGEVWLSIPEAYRFELRAVRPNPTRGALQAAFELAEEGRVSLDVLDIAGRRVMARDAGVLPAGDHVIDLARDGELAPGVYLMRVREGGAVAHARVIVIR